MRVRSFQTVSLTLFLLLTTVLSMAADLVVVTHPSNGIEKMSKDEVINIYMGRYRKLANGETAIPLDLKQPPGEKAQFYSILVGKELAEINSYWARLMFSGQGSPPRQAENVDEAIEFVKNNKGALAYIDRKKVDKRVKVIFDLAQ
ncbi:hypothetical protein [Undibacterium sp. Ren11W]|uniref:hypothetical protein n=1 Tax=Undibacterium sp. Ren11W TaxID=3413045 RepID=UPI003BF2F7B5